MRRAHWTRRYIRNNVSCCETVRPSQGTAAVTASDQDRPNTLMFIAKSVYVIYQTAKVYNSAILYPGSVCNNISYMTIKSLK